MLVKRGLVGGSKWLHGHKGRTYDHQFAAGRYYSEYASWCPWLWYSSKKVQVLSGAGMCLRPDPQ